MPTPVGPQLQSNPAQAQLRSQLLTIFRDSRQLKENSAQLRQRLVGGVFSTIQGQIDQARAERFSESEASKGRKGALIQTGVKAAIPVVGGAVTGGIAGGLSGVEGGAGLGALAGASAGFGLPTTRAGSPASAVFGQFSANQAGLKEAGVGAQKFVPSTVVPPSPVSAASPAGPALITPTFPEDFVGPAAGVEKATNAIAQIAGLDNDQLIFAGEQAVDAGDEQTVALIAEELQRRGL